MDRSGKQPGLDALAREPSRGGVAQWRGNRLRAAVCVRDLLLAVLGQDQEPQAPLVRHEELWQPRQGPEILPSAKSRLGGLALIDSRTRRQSKNEPGHARVRRQGLPVKVVLQHRCFFSAPKYGSGGPVGPPLLSS